MKTESPSVGNNQWLIFYKCESFMIVEDINLCFLVDWKDSFLKISLSEATLTFIFLAYYFIANKAILSFYFPDSFIGFIVILVSMLKVFKQLRKHQLINFVKDYRCQLAPTTSVSYPLLNMLTLTSKFSSTSHAIHHKNLIKSNYEGRGFEVQQLFNGCLAIYSYYVESGQDCFLIDPLFDIAQYVKLIKNRGKNLKGIFITHYHADYLSGQHQLAKTFKCKIYMGPQSIVSSGVENMHDGQQITLGKIKLQCWHTPGHTEESSCLVLLDETGKKDTVFTGDTLFLGEVGRPDLAVKTNLTARDLAGMLYQSIQKLKTLDDDVRIYPGHGSGSACGKSIEKGDFCIMKNQKQTNYGLKAKNREEFVEKVLSEMPQAPHYFAYNANINKFQPFFHQITSKVIHEHLTPERVMELARQENVVIIDMRANDALREGIIEGSLCISFDGGFANWVGTLLSPYDRIILFGNDEKQFQEAVTRLFRIGYINIIGRVNFTIQDWKAKTYPVTVPDFVNQIVQDDTVVLDVRKPDEWNKDGVVRGSVRLELSDLFNHPEKLEKSKTYVAHCGSGYRAKIAWSFLKSQGFKAKAFPFPFETIFKSGKATKITL